VNRRRSAAWIAENQEVVVPKLRRLRYLGNVRGTAQEKGIEVLLAIDAVDAPPVFHHFVDAELFSRVERRVNYAHDR
jgi:hypothetical protein